MDEYETAQEKRLREHMEWLDAETAWMEEAEALVHKYFPGALSFRMEVDVGDEWRPPRGRARAELRETKDGWVSVNMNGAPPPEVPGQLRLGE